MPEPTGPASRTPAGRRSRAVLFGVLGSFAALVVADVLGDADASRRAVPVELLFIGTAILGAIGLTLLPPAGAVGESGPAGPGLPGGTVTFLFTDVEGSTRLWERHPESMRAALARHDALIEAFTARHGGTVVRPRGEGDSRFAVFARATEAVAAAAAIQRALHAEPWPPETPLRVRLALHTGEADLRGGDYYGSAVNRCARLRAIAHGGQTLLSQATYHLVRDALPAGVAVRDLGAHRLSDLARQEHVFQLVAPGAAADFPPLRSLDALAPNVPARVTSFVGREREAAESGRPVMEQRLVMLTGPGGVGESPLALPGAPDAPPVFADGMWLVELAALADSAMKAQGRYGYSTVLPPNGTSGRFQVAVLVCALTACTRPAISPNRTRSRRAARRVYPGADPYPAWSKGGPEAVRHHLEEASRPSTGSRGNVWLLARLLRALLRRQDDVVLQRLLLRQQLPFVRRARAATGTAPVGWCRPCDPAHTAPVRRLTARCPDPPDHGSGARQGTPRNRADHRRRWGRAN